jgi:Ca-activated chloride channel homolog
MNTHFLHPAFFWLFALFPLLIFWYLKNRNQQVATFKISTLSGFKTQNHWLGKIRPLLFVLRLIALAFIIVALARPQGININSKTNTIFGIDIVMAIDVSGSMLAKDLRPNRLESLKKVAAKFVMNRPTDRIGLVLYAAEAYTKTPVTNDKNVLLDAMSQIKYDNVLKDGTGIGMGLATAVNRLKDSKAKSKVIILLTDGVNNAGFIEPETASDIAKEHGIKVYTIGIGTNGMAEFPYAYDGKGGFLYKMMKVEIDEQLMKSIALKTDGRYFRATSNSSLEAIYDEINKLETTEIKENKFINFDELFRPYLLAAGLLLLIEFLLRNTIFKGFI